MVHVSAQQEFSDADWRAVATADQSKKLKLLLSGLTTGTTRVLTIPDADGTIMLTSAIGVTVQAYDADLASWAAVTRASGFDTFTATPSSANLRSLLTDETGTGAAVFAGGNIGAATATSLTINGGTALDNFDISTWTATLTNGANVVSTTWTAGKFERYGSRVHAWGRLAIDPTAAANTLTVVDISLPVASNFGSIHDALGLMVPALGGPHQPGGIIANTTNDRVTLQFSSETTSLGAFIIDFWYTVI